MPAVEGCGKFVLPQFRERGSVSILSVEYRSVFIFNRQMWTPRQAHRKAGEFGTEGGADFWRFTMLCYFSDAPIGRGGRDGWVCT